MKYKVGDRVRIKSLDWYNENKDEYGHINAGARFIFHKDMSRWCGETMTILKVYQTYYAMEDDYISQFFWTDEMIEGLAEEETKPNVIEEAKTYWDSIKDAWICPEGYIFKDENGNVINATKIVLEKKKEYPKTYEECCAELNYLPFTDEIVGYKWDLMQILQQLLICRDAYWKIAGEEMGLGKPWEPDWKNGDQKKYCIYNDTGDICNGSWFFCNAIFAFPTEEMRDAFKENFDKDLEICKEFL